MFSRRVLLTTAFAFLLPAASFAAETASPTATASGTAAKPANAPVTREELPDLIRKTLVENPDIMLDVMKEVQKSQADRAKKEAVEGLKKHQAALFTGDAYPSVGPKDADVTIVEFFDYHCGYCKRMLPTITELLKQDKKVRIVLRDMPILSEDSEVAAKASLAVYRLAPAKYFEFHTALMKVSGKFDEKTLAEAAKKVGVDAAKLKKEMENPEIAKLLEATSEVAADIGVRGTPAIAFPDKLVPGAAPLDDLQRLIDMQRSGQKE